MIVDENGMCTLNEEDYSYHSNGREKRKTNADRIRAMTDEEMADYLRWHKDLYSRNGMDWLDWLKQEADNG